MLNENCAELLEAIEWEQPEWFQRFAMDQPEIKEGEGISLD